MLLPKFRAAHVVHRCVVTLTILFTGSSPAFGKTPWIPLDIQLNQKEREIWFALQETTQIDFFDVQLEEAIQFLMDLHKIQIELDLRLLEDAGVSAATPLTKSVQGISLRSALQNLLRQQELSWIIDNEVLLITTAEEVAARHRVHVYDVSSLLDKGETTEELVDLIYDIFPTFDDDAIAHHRVLAHKQLLIVRATPRDHQEVSDLLRMICAGLGLDVGALQDPSRSHDQQAQSRDKIRRPKPPKQDPRGQHDNSEDLFGASGGNRSRGDEADQDDPFDLSGDDPFDE